MMAPAQHEIRPTTQPETTVEDLAADISRHLVDLDVLARFVAALTDSRNPNLGFLDAGVAKAQDAMIRADRNAAYDRTERPPGLQWMRHTPSVNGIKRVQSAGNMAAISVEADITFALADIARRIIAALDRVGVCAIHRPKPEPTISEQIGHVRALVWAAPSLQLLASVERDVRRLVETATLVVDGDDKYQLNNPCPHCQRRTLVVYLRDGVVRCDRNRRTGHYDACTCPELVCSCKTNPHTFRHEWYSTTDRLRDNRDARSWDALGIRLKLAADQPTTSTTNRQEPTR